jgi:hypothetical protein
MKNRYTHIVGTVPKYNSKIIEWGSIDTLEHIYMTAHCMTAWHSIFSETSYIK